MNRRAIGTIAVVLALVGSIGAAAQVQRRPIKQNWWQMERTFQLTQILERARASHHNALLRVEIGTLAPIDVKASQDALAQVEAMVKADAARPTPPQGDRTTRTRLAELLNNLDAAEVRFDNGMITTQEMNAAYLRIVRLLVEG